MNKTFKVQAKSGRTLFVVERQLPHDKKYTVGSRIPGRGVVIEILPDDTLERLMERQDRKMAGS